MLRATPGEIGRYLESVRIDPHFRSFVRLCRSKGAAITVVSDGMDLIVGTVLRHAGLDIGFHANELCWQGEDRWTLKFPFAREDCAARIGNCKCSHRRAAGGSPSIMVGDGRSDFCIARECDFVLAKGALAAHCARLALPFAEICDFADARRLLAAWLRRRSSPTVSARVSRSDATAALKSAS
jgi:2-hydroxy-3-keto-5-methylthiopentenyl-1-phosphate phosphatase